MEMAWKQITDYSAKSRRKNITDQKLKVNNSHQILKACCKFIVDLLTYERLEAWEDLEGDLSLGK